jgi:hypothetical protein
MKFLGINISVDIKDRRAQLIIAIGVSIGIAIFLGAAGFALMLKGMDGKEGDMKDGPAIEESADEGYLDEQYDTTYGDESDTQVDE